MKLLGFTFATSVLCLSMVVPPSAIAHAQEEATTGAEKAQKLAQVLNLNSQQQSQLAPILQAEGPKVQSIVHDPNLSQSEKKSRLNSVYSQSNPLVKTILNPTQYKQWQIIRKDELESMNLK
jgi:hypothetical protein